MHPLKAKVSSKFSEKKEKKGKVENSFIKKPRSEKKEGERTEAAAAAAAAVE